jgi:hypothetical protein
MKKGLLFGLSLIALSLSSATQAQITCYPEEEATANEFWTSHFFYASCTDYIGTGSKLFEDGSSGMVDFNGGSSVDFTKIHVTEDAEYTVTLKYAIGWCDEFGATVTVFVNDELYDQLTLFRGAGDWPWSVEFDVELYSDYDNVIKFQQVKDWPILLGIQLTKQGGNGLDKINKSSYTLSSTQQEIKIENLSDASQIQIYSVDGKLIRSAKVAASAYSVPVQTSGVYIVKINGEANKVVVR